MRQIVRLISFLGLLLTIGPSVFVLYGVISWNLHASLMLVGMVLWFSTAPFWIRSDRT